MTVKPLLLIIVLMFLELQQITVSINIGGGSATEAIDRLAIIAMIAIGHRRHLLLEVAV